MKPYVIPLTSAEGGAWPTTLVQRSLVRPDGTSIPFDGAAWVASNARRQGDEESATDRPRESYRLTFAADLSALLKTKLEINLAVKGAAVVLVTHRDKVLIRSNFESPDALQLKTYAIDLTQSVEPAAANKVTIEVFFSESAPSSSLVVIPATEVGCQIVQSWSSWYSMSSITFFATSSLLLLATLVWMCGVVSRAAVPLRAMAIVLSGFVWLWEVLQMPKSIGGRGLLRRAYGFTSRWRWPVVGAMAVAVIICGLRAYDVIEVLSARYTYTDRIMRALTPGQSELAERAFAQFPWRREAQILMERDAMNLRAGSELHRKELLRAFISRTGVATAARQPLAKFRQYLDDDAATNDPAILFTSFLMEAGVPEGPKSKAWRTLLGDCLDVLRDHTGDEVDVQRLIIGAQLHLITRDELIEGLTNKLIAFKDARFPTLFLYQHGADTLASLHILRARDGISSCRQHACTSAELANIGGDLAAAKKWYERVIEQRAFVTKADSDVVAWLRPPHKLEVFHILTARPEDQSEGAIAGRARLQRYDEGRCFLSGQTPCPKDQLRAELKNDFPEYGNALKWNDGTVNDGAIIKRIKDEMLNQGWRY